MKKRIFEKLNGERIRDGNRIRGEKKEREMPYSLSNGTSVLSVDAHLHKRNNRSS